MKIYNKVLSTAQALNTNVITEALPLEHIYGYAVQVNCVGTPNGTFKLQASTDETTPTNWTDITGSSVSATTLNFSFLWNVTDVMYSHVRVVFTDASAGASAAVARITINSKGV